jgi:hypothetical protein
MAVDSSHPAAKGVHDSVLKHDSTVGYLNLHTLDLHARSSSFLCPAEMSKHIPARRTSKRSTRAVIAQIRGTAA